MKQCCVAFFVKNLLWVSLPLLCGDIKPHTLTNNKNDLLIISIPKCGTNMLVKTIDLLVGKPFGINNTLAGFRINQNVLLKRILNQPKDTPMYIHTPFTKQAESLLMQYAMKVFFIYRDPRDCAISLAFFLKKLWSRRFNSYSQEQLISMAIASHEMYDAGLFRGIPNFVITDVNACFQTFLPWRQCPIIYTTRFEDLVGPQGGGDSESQMREIRNIAKHLGIEKTEDELTDVAGMLFGRTWSTFREGQIGSWKKHFTPALKEKFKRIAGQLLIDLGYEKDFDW